MICEKCGMEAVHGRCWACVDDVVSQLHIALARIKGLSIENENLRAENADRRLTAVTLEATAMMVHAQLAGMEVANAEREAHGEALAYDEEAFSRVSKPLCEAIERVERIYQADWMTGRDEPEGKHKENQQEEV